MPLKYKVGDKVVVSGLTLPYPCDGRVQDGDVVTILHLCDENMKFNCHYAITPKCGGAAWWIEDSEIDHAATEQLNANPS